MNIFKSIKSNIQSRFDGLVDPSTSRGSTIDKTVRLTGRSIIDNDSKNLSLFVSNGFVQNIVTAPALDSIREWITIKTNLDADDEEVNYSKMIEDRLEELGVRKKIYDLIFYSRLYAKGAFMYYSVKANQVQQGPILAQPIPSEIRSIEFINVIDNNGLVTLENKNSYDPTKNDYNQFRYHISGQEIHPSRLSWLVNNFIPKEQSGISVVQTVSDSIVAQDNALWSVATILNTMAMNIFKSDEIAELSPEQKGELLAKIKHLMITMSSMALKKEESFEQITLQASGLKEMFDFVFDNMAGLSEIPKNILLGKSHGVVTAGEYDTLNYYANISRFQELELRKIIQKIIDMVISEKDGEIYRALNGNIDQIDATFEFNSLWKLDPVSQADKELKNSQRDQIDITVMKTSPSEARQLDERYADLEPFEVNRDVPPDMAEPDQAEPDQLEVPEENQTSEK